MLWQGGIRHGIAGGIEVDQQRHNRMAIRGHGDFNLAAILQLAITRHDVFKNIRHDQHQGLLVVTVEMFFCQALVNQLFNPFVTQAQGMTHPGEVIPDQQVGKKGGVEIR